MGQVWEEGEERLTQGRPGSSGRFCVSLHPDVRQLDAEVRMGGGGEEEGGSVFGNDYGYLFSPPGIVFPALERFAARILDRCSLHSALRQKCFAGGTCRLEPQQT